MSVLGNLLQLVWDFSKWIWAWIKSGWNAMAARQDSERRITRWLLIIPAPLFMGLLGWYGYAEMTRANQRTDNNARATYDYNLYKGNREECLKPNLSAEDAQWCTQHKGEWSLSYINNISAAYHSVSNILRPWGQGVSLTVSGLPIYLNMSVESVVFFGAFAFLWSLRSRMSSFHNATTIAGKITIVLYALGNAAAVACICAMPSLGMFAVFCMAMKALWHGQLEGNAADWFGRSASPRRQKLLMLVGAVYLLPYYSSIRGDGSLDVQAIVAGNWLLSSFLITVGLAYFLRTAMQASVNVKTPSREPSMNASPKATAVPRTAEIWDVD